MKKCKYFLGLYFLFQTACTINASIENVASDSPSVSIVAPDAPSSLALVTPASSPSTDTTPTIRVSGVVSGYNVKLYSNSTCATEIASGVASGLTIDLTSSTLAVGTYSLHAKSIDASGTASACSTASLAYEVLDGTLPHHLAFRTHPANTQQNRTMAVVEVEIRNVDNVLLTTASSTVLIAIQTDPSGSNAVLNGTVSVTAIGGIARFASLEIDEVGVGYVLRASSTGLTSADSNTFNITSGPTMIYRSIGQDLSALVSGSSSAKLSISGSIATFDADPIYGFLGNGIEYDSNGDGSIDSVAFFYRRISATQYKVKSAAGGTPTATTNSQTWSILYAYFSPTNAESGVENIGFDAATENFDTWSGGRDLVANNEIWVMVGISHNSGSTYATIDGWTTSATNYLKIYRPRYTTEVAAAINSFTFSRNAVGPLLDIRDEYVVLDGLTFSYTQSMDGSDSFITTSTTTGELQIANCRFYYSASANTGTGNHVINIGSGNLKAWNNNFDVINKGNLGAAIYFNAASKSAYVYNNTIISCNTGISRANGTVIAKNNYIQACLDGFAGTFDAASDYNLSNVKSDAPGSNSVNGVSDFNNSTGRALLALAGGIDLSADSNLSFTTDINGVYRSPYWNIGAYNNPIKVRSVGFGNTTARDSGGGGMSLSVSDGLATFSGGGPWGEVGDTLEYTGVNGLTLAVIYRRITNNVFRIVTPDLLIPDNTSVADTAWSIKRSYTSLTNAASRTESTAITSSLRDYDSSSSLTSAAFFIYNDSVFAEDASFDSTWSTVDFYVPYSSKHTFVTARHSGQWSSGKSIISGQLQISAASSSWIEGIQFSTANSKNSIIANLSNYDSVISINANIFKATGATNPGEAIRLNADNTVFVMNNLFYDYKNSSSDASVLLDTVGLSYSPQIIFNTFYNCDFGIVSANSYLTIQNNIFQKCLDGIQVTYSTYVNYNVSDLAGDSAGANSFNSTKLNFEDPQNRNFLLSPKEKIARNHALVLTTSGWSTGNGVLLSYFDLGNTPRLGRPLHMGALQGPYVRYRSVGSNSAAIAAGGASTVTIASNVATFSAGISNSVGVGDVLQYTATPLIAVITERISSTQFRLATTEDKNVPDQTATTTWNIYRAYLSLGKHDVGDENDTLSNTVENFDTTSFLTDYDYIDFLNLYKDGVDATSPAWLAFTSDRRNYIYLNVPADSNEVGTSQRHTGIPGTGYQRGVDNYAFSYPHWSAFDGLEFTMGTSVDGSAHSTLNASAFLVKNCLFYYGGTATDSRAISIQYTGERVDIINNIIIGFPVGIITSTRANIVGNTVINASQGILMGSPAGETSIVANNVAFGCTTKCFDESVGSGGYSAGSTNNIASDNSAPGTNSLQTVQANTVLFLNPAANDYHIKDTNSDLYNRGADLSSSESFYQFFLDIDLGTRSGTWDVGADEY